MNSNAALRGVLAPNLTPFEADGSIAMDLYVAHATALLQRGCVGLVPFGTTGEALSVGIEARITALEALVEAGIDPRQLLPGAGLTSLADTLRLVRAAHRLGCRGVLVLPPFFFKNVPPDGLFRYFAELVAALPDSACGIHIYHIPQVAGVGVPPEVVRRLREAFPDHIRGIKDSSGVWDNLTALLDIPGLDVYPGQEVRLVEAMERGAPGCISATANLNSAAIAEVAGKFDANAREAAAAGMPDLRAFRKTVEGYAPIPAMKGLLARATGDRRWWNVRPPLLPADPGEVEALETALREGFGVSAAAGA